MKPSPAGTGITHVLIVEDDPDAALTLREMIGVERFTVAVAHTLRDARRQIVLQQPDIVLLDLQLPDGNGMDLFADAQFAASCEVVLITGHASLETSIKALRLGAADYLVKPINPRQLQGVLSRFMKPAVLQAEVDSMAATVSADGHFGHLWGNSPPMRRLYEQVARVAATAVTVFITGESGSGKEVVAQTVHDLSRRRKQPFLAVNCGAISHNLIESEIFGHEKGSFTGAERMHQGFFERANGGTLFLDEITEMPLELQVKLLRVLETGRFMRVGSTTSQESDVRVIAATNRQPKQAVAEGRLREDLLYRLNVFPIELPPLRDRLSDVPLLVNHFLKAIVEQEGTAKSFSAEALAHLSRYHWPGNVRELRNVVQRTYVMAQGPVIDTSWLPALEHGETAAPAPPPAAPEPAAAQAAAGAPPPPGSSPPTPAPAPAAPSVVLPIGISMAEAERELILATLLHLHHHKERTAATLGVSLKTLYNRLKDYAAEGDDVDNARPPG
jgi:two-component system, NtrC family, response regulator AtoC